MYGRGGRGFVQRSFGTNDVRETSRPSAVPSISKTPPFCPPGRRKCPQHFCGHFLVHESQTPGPPGRRKRSPNFGGRFLCKIESQTSFKPKKMLANFLRAFSWDWKIELLSRIGLWTESPEEEGKERRSRGLTARLDASTHFLYGGGRDPGTKPPEIKITKNRSPKIPLSGSKLFVSGGGWVKMD